MALIASEAKDVAVKLWECFNVSPDMSYGSRAFMRIVEHEFNKAILAKQNRLNPPHPVPTVAAE
ncbi:hypothetical protein [Frigidibacter oleivorans]|uniref:hypothetical protein n=1 Tax=Frigidibacter oleivorans TaxID=2487129 RepID=UPI000F8F2740|nr:hypothetical protein [Frigidibacter oleivorans]